MTTLQDKTALVTGASRGIGRATAAALARAGKIPLVPQSPRTSPSKRWDVGVLDRDKPRH